jgi:hypothetical protein
MVLNVPRKNYVVSDSAVWGSVTAITETMIECST